MRADKFILREPRMMRPPRVHSPILIAAAPRH
jgi:hypothetical protein